MSDNNQKEQKNEYSDGVAVRDYTAAHGVSAAVDWDGENVTVGGNKIKPLYVKNGVAYGDKTEVDSAIKGIQNGIESENNSEKRTEEKYGKAKDNTLSKVINRDEFSYNPDNDPVYDAYSNKYKREAELAFRSILNENNSSVYGATGAVLSEATAQRDRYLKELADKIPDLAATAYNRYQGEGERLTDNFKLVSDLADSYYDRHYESERDKHNDVINAGIDEREEKQRWIDNDYNEKSLQAETSRNAINDYYDNLLKSQSVAKGNKELGNIDTEIADKNLEQRLSNESAALDNAITRGFFTKSDEAALPWLSAYRTAGGYTLNPQLAAAENEYRIYHAREQAKW